jgi:hypothetical protein
MNSFNIDENFANISLKDQEETYLDRLARSTVEERFNTLQVGQPRRCFNLSEYNRDDIDAEIEAWKFGRYYPVNGLLGGDDNGAEIVISNEARTQIKLIIDAGYSVRHQSLALKDILIHDGIITATTTYGELLANHLLKDALYDVFAVSLPDNVAQSKYGCGIVSDFDLCVNMKHVADFEKRMKELNVSNLTEEYDRLRKNRSNVGKFLRRLLELVYESFGLLETPDKAQKKPKLTKEDVAKRGEEKLQKLAKKGQKLVKNGKKSDVEKANDECPSDLDLNDARLIAMDEAESDELDEVPVEKKTKEGYLKDGFVVDDKYVMDVDKKKRVLDDFKGRLGGSNKESVVESIAPDAVIQALIDSYLKQHYRSTVKIWEVACGSDQRIVKQLQSAGFSNVTYSDLRGESFGVTQHDFLEEGTGLYESHEYELIICKPPQSKCKAFIQKAMELGKPFMFLDKLEMFGTAYLRNFVINESYDFMGLPIQDGFCWLIGLPRKTRGKVAEVVLKYYPMATAVEEQEVVEVEETIILNGVNYCASFLQFCGIDPGLLFKEIVKEKELTFQPRDAHYMKYRGNELKRTKAFVYDGDDEHIPVYTYPVSLYSSLHLSFYVFYRDLCMKACYTILLVKNMEECWSKLKASLKIIWVRRSTI